MSDPKLTHNMEQMLAMMLEFAVSLARYHQQLVENGFTREEALEIVLGYQTTLLLKAKGGGAG